MRRLLRRPGGGLVSLLPAAAVRPPLLLAPVGSRLLGARSRRRRSSEATAPQPRDGSQKPRALPAWSPEQRASNHEQLEARGGGEQCGFIVLDKPVGLTSHDCVAAVRRRLQTKKVRAPGASISLLAGGFHFPLPPVLLPLAGARALHLRS